MDTPHFFSDMVADMEGDASYPPTLDRDERLSGPGDGAAGTYQHDYSYHGSSGMSAAIPPSSSAMYPPGGGAWTRPTGHQMSSEGYLSRPAQHFEPALHPRDAIAIAGDMREAMAPSPSSISTARTASLPRTNSNSTTATVTPITPFEAPPPPAPQSPPKKRKGRTRKTSTAVEEEAKRNRFLERNRVAASRCRQKKKEAHKELIDRRIGLESKHTLLRIEHDALVEEMGHIKSMLMEHASCNDPKIDKWMENEARKFVHSASTQLDQSQAAYGQPSEGRHLSMASVGSAGSAYAGAGYDDADAAQRRASMTFSHTPSLHTSPVMPQFPNMMPPPPQQSDEANFDHLTSHHTFSPFQQQFPGR